MSNRSTAPTAAQLQQREGQYELQVFSISWGLAQVQLWNKRSKFIWGLALFQASTATSHLAKMQMSTVERCQAHITHKILCYSEWSQTLQERTGADHYSNAGLVENSLFSTLTECCGAAICQVLTSITVWTQCEHVPTSTLKQHGQILTPGS